jgi:hypothetical protein
MSPSHLPSRTAASPTRPTILILHYPGLQNQSASNVIMFVPPEDGFCSPPHHHLWGLERQCGRPHPELSAVEKLQRTQNNAMQVITGLHKMASRDHLLAETKLLPVKAHLGLVCSQFLVSASRASHPSNSIVKIPTGERKGKKGIIHTLQSRFGHVIQPFLNEEGNLPEVSYKRALDSIHTAVVAEEKRKLTCKALGTAPTDISPEESSLPRYRRSILNQIRLTYSNSSRSYQARIESAPDDLCQICWGAAHTTEHLFNCPSMPTDIRVRDL